MLRFERPEPHPDFLGNDATLEQARKSVEQAISSGERPSFPGHWRKAKYKRILMAAQHGKCGYCECKIRPGQTGDVEHYAPKGEVSLLEQPGREVSGLSNIEGRRFMVISSQGYWWLAYEWSNYLIACGGCNRWKSSLFPVRETPRQLPPRPDVAEEPLVLGPYGPVDPMDHLLFDDLGEIRSATEYGEATIEVCGLDRESLREARQEKAELVWDLFRELLESTDMTPPLRRLLHAGQESAAHAGMVRSMVKAELGLEWWQLQAAVLRV